jgi:hypothetical protein
MRIIACDASLLEYYEKRLIRYFNPKYNIKDCVDARKKTVLLSERGFRSIVTGKFINGY